jgi:hypothetical protein
VRRRDREREALRAAQAGLESPPARQWPRWPQWFLETLSSLYLVALGLLMLAAVIECW